VVMLTVIGVLDSLRGSTVCGIVMKYLPTPLMDSLL
jgi:hypothetical protein